MKKLLFVFCLLTSTVIKAQEPTLEETIDFIKVKLSPSTFWYSPQSSVSSTGCDGDHKYFFEKIKSVQYHNKKLEFTNVGICGGDGKLILDLTKVKSIGYVSADNKTVTISSNGPFFEVYYEGKKIEPDGNTKIKFNNVDNSEKLLKALKHLFKLLNIQMLDDKF